ncbi:MAG: methyltransferase domain-containing protein [Candidatus Eremiobacteraeota bacterium]|nr:methyltransferase domain-containing protein [Candidatus Eremiobacteraeota bacterium]
MSQAPHSPRFADTFAAAHPLAQRLIGRLANDAGARILEIGTGSGRNTRALRDAGFSVVTINDARFASPDAPAAGADFAAAISTHALLHGDSETVAHATRRIAWALKPGAWLYGTFGSSRDARFGQGQRIDDCTFAPLQGDERGVPHVYFNERRLRALLEPYFGVESLEEHDVDRVAGSWAHRERPLSGAVHWFATARRR